MKAEVITLFDAYGKISNKLLTCLSFTFFSLSLKIKSDFNATKVEVIIVFDDFGNVSVF